MSSQPVAYTITTRGSDQTQTSPPASRLGSGAGRHAQDASHGLYYSRTPKSG